MSAQNDFYILIANYPIVDFFPSTFCKYGKSKIVLARGFIFKIFLLDKGSELKF